MQAFDDWRSWSQHVCTDVVLSVRVTRCINCIVLLSAAIPIDEITAIMHSSFTACMHEGSGEGCRRIRQKKMLPAKYGGV